MWLEGYQALRRWRTENNITGLCAVPYTAETRLGATSTYPVGRWIHQQRRAHRAGELDPSRKKQLDGEGMVWEPGEEAWETKLRALATYRHAHGHLAPRQDATWPADGENGEPVPIGQLITNLRRPHGLGKDEKRADQRAKQLIDIDPDWDCPWPLDWQRHHRILAQLATDEADGLLPAIEPGVLFEGDDLGKWLKRQQQANVWAQLSGEQQTRLTKLGVTPAEHPTPAPVPAAKGRRTATGTASAAFQRGVAALAQYIAREGHHRVPRGHAEQIAVEGQTAPVVVKLGVWISNTKSRRDRLTPGQHAALAELGVEWA